MRDHRYGKLLFPARREGRWVGRHRGRGHAVTHYGFRDEAGRCYWYCSCKARYWC